MTRFFFVLLAASWISAGTAHAESAQEGEALHWLQKAAAAARQMNYSGVFIHRYGNHVETSRITHAVDGSGEHEKLEALDGPPREVIRNDGQVLCYLPDNKTVITEKRRARKAFPALLPSRVGGLGENYQIKMGAQERVGGHDCRLIIIEPRDAFRYGHVLCAENKTALLLKASLVNQKHETVEQFSFTHLDIGGKIEKSQLLPRLAGKSAARDNPAQVEELAPDTGWVVKQPPPGFTKVMEMKRTMAGKKSPVNHLVLSDGVVAVSVFIEPWAEIANPSQGLSSQGAVNVYARRVADSQVTVLGEVPAATVMQIGNSVVYGEK